MIDLRHIRDVSGRDVSGRDVSGRDSNPAQLLAALIAVVNLQVAGRVGWR